MINLIVVGGGESFDKYVAASVYQRNPEIHPRLGMRIHTLIDIVPRSDLYPATREAMDRFGINYLQVTSGQDLLGSLVLPPNPAAIVATPNSSHFFYGEMLTGMGIPTLVEKPPVCSRGDLQKFREVGRERSELWYNSESNVDGKALGLLFLFGMLRKDDPRRVHLRMTPGYTTDDQAMKIVQSLGYLRRIEGRMLEGTGSAGTADHRRWLLDGTQGGMIRDLASHLLGPIIDAGVITNVEVYDPRVDLGVHDADMSLCDYRSIRSPEEGETYARIRGLFGSPFQYREERVPFDFQMGKYWNNHDRFLEMVFDEGVVRMSYESPYDVEVIMGYKKATVNLHIAVWPYSLALMDFEEFVRGVHGSNNHFGRALGIASFNETMREAGLKRAGVTS